VKQLDTTGCEERGWFDDALAQAPDERDVVVEGARIHYLHWGEAGDPGVVLVHGGLAHARWWEHIAPLLSGHEIVALDLSGHGDSSPREVHDVRQWAREIVAVAEDAGLERPTVVGHSVGGTPAVAVGVDFPELVRAVITVDSRFNDYEWPSRHKPSPTYASIEDAIADFQPAHPVAGVEPVPYVQRRVAESSLSRQGDVWRWKRADHFRLTGVRMRELLPDLQIPLTLVRTEHGILSAEAAAEMRSLTPAEVDEVLIHGAAHNPMLEQPRALAETLATLLRKH
jgi:pimeloyl-ACP methyl ester carboxylesterase